MFGSVFTFEARRELAKIVECGGTEEEERETCQACLPAPEEAHM